MRAPNSEQKVAIEHTGGVLLSAGAGSGKTFVLVEHVIYLLNIFQEKHKDLPESEFKSSLREYLSGIVLMTFTNKAAAEISIRLEKRLEDEISSHDSGLKRLLWSWMIDTIDSINISTIHGLCYQLLRKGYFPKYENNLDIVSEVDILQRVKQLLSQWFVQYKKDNQYELGNNQNIETVISNQANLVDSLTSIFLDPQLRLMWTKIDLESLLEIEDDYFIKVIKLLEIHYLFDSRFNIQAYAEYSDKKWFEHIEDFSALARNTTEFNIESLSKFDDFFIKYKGVRGPSKKLELDEITLIMDDIKKLRAFLSKNADDYLTFFEKKDTLVKDWMKIFLDIFTFVDEKFDDFYGVTFSDLEYYVYTSLQNEQYKERVNQDYRYFIVDEFQDTSTIQFEILNKLCNSDFSKVFCVGDVKQAIYGFRGGEIAVFEKCKTLISTNLNLSHNYRSDKKLIEFNNSFFNSILPLGQNFSGLDQYSVQSEGQSYPNVNADKNIGEIKKMMTPLVIPKDEKSKSVKISNNDINFLEAKNTILKIKELRELNPDCEICLLYKSLGPSEFIISKLIENEIGFSSQVKIPLGEDAIISIFSLLLEFYLSKATKKYSHDSKVKYISFLISGHLNIINSQFKSDQNKFEIALEQFVKDVTFIGVKEAFYKFIYVLGIVNGDYDNNVSLIESLIQMGRDNIEKIYTAIQSYKGKKYSTQFIFGKGSSKLKIMTTHASKGLEFDHVFLMGVHTNGRRMPDLNFFGKLPGSCKFRSDQNSRKTNKTPMLILEGLISAHKDFSESKRLLYVACTRAVKGLYWSDFSDDHELTGAGANCWINGLRYFEKYSNEKEEFSENKMKELVYDPEQVALKTGTPFFHQDSGGLSAKDHNIDLFHVSELSVTRLASAADCPKKFYLMNICKIEDEDLETIEVFHKTSFKKNTSSPTEGSAIISSSDRGTKLHDKISKSILNQSFICNPKNVDELDLKILNTVLTNLEKYKADYGYHSEVQIKFSLFGMMVSGIPDLVIRPNSKNDTHITTIFDFKTGDISKDNKSYWYQLLCYGLHEYENEHISKTQKIKLILYYIDKDEQIEKILDYNKVKELLTGLVSSLGAMQTMNKDHCQKCQYNLVCY